MRGLLQGERITWILLFAALWPSLPFVLVAVPLGSAAFAMAGSLLAQRAGGVMPEIRFLSAVVLAFLWFVAAATV